MHTITLVLHSMMLRQFEEALKSYKSVIKLEPEFAEAHNNLGITLKELGRLDEAEKSLQKSDRA